VQAFADLGVSKVRLTGGEPTVRPDFLQIVKTISKNASIKPIALSTNGYRLSRRVSSYFAAGIRHLNVSIDSLNPENFRKITGKDHLREILDGIDLALGLPFVAVKVNAVLTSKLIPDELALFTDWIKDRKVTVRFIELMPTRNSSNFAKEHFVKSSALASTLRENGWKAIKRQPTDGPAQVYEHISTQGRIGIIAPYEEGFCQSCNRVRVDAYGELQLCLWGRGKLSLRSLLQTDDQTNELKAVLVKQLQLKPPKHELHSGKHRGLSSLSTIGG
jgi:cyclic pyranopterin phosphate synthase